eukprot:scaffold437037_cov20-Prasinocladus_malaysianus.AAC.1
MEERLKLLPASVVMCEGGTLHQNSNKSRVILPKTMRTSCSCVIEKRMNFVRYDASGRGARKFELSLLSSGPYPECTLAIKPIEMNELWPICWLMSSSGWEQHASCG